ncbi:MAG: HD domain-containing protein [Vicinamibacterales bacterium]
MAKVLRLHEELTEAIALGHDLGHTPFGHAGERVLDSLVPGDSTTTSRAASWTSWSATGKASTSQEVRDGIARHSKEEQAAGGGRRNLRASTIEGQLARGRHRRLREPRHR